MTTHTYRCPRCDFTYTSGLPLVAVLCPREHRDSAGRALGRVEMVEEGEAK